MVHIVQESKIYWLYAREMLTCGYRASSTFIYILICAVILLKFSPTYANENSEIQEVFDNVAKYIKADDKYQNFEVIERKSNKFNIKVAQNFRKSLSIHSILERAQESFESGDNEAAISFLSQVIAKFPYHKNALIGLGNIYYYNKEYEKSIEIYVRLLKEYPSNSYILENFLTIVSHYNPDLALSEMLKLYDIRKNCAPLLANLGLIYMKKAAYMKAREYMIGAISLDQENIFYIYNLAVILDKLSDFKNASTFYLKLLDIVANSQEVSEKIPIQKVKARVKFIKLHRHAWQLYKSRQALSRRELYGSCDL